MLYSARLCNLLFVVYFNDEDCAHQVLSESGPWKQKQIAKSVKNFNETVWNTISRKIVQQGTTAKVNI